MSNMIKGDPNPKNYEQMYLELIDNIDNMGFKISLDMKNLKGQYYADKQARAEMMNKQYEEQQQAEANKKDEQQQQSGQESQSK